MKLAIGMHVTHATERSGTRYRVIDFDRSNVIIRRISLCQSLTDPTKMEWCDSGDEAENYPRIHFEILFQEAR